MANFDLISEDDFFSGEQKKTEKEKPEKPQADEDLFAQPLPEKDFLSDDMDIAENPETDFPDPIGADSSQDFNADVNENFDFNPSQADEESPNAANEEAPPVSPEPAAEENSYSDNQTDYYDDEPLKKNYKPLIVGILVVVFLGVLFFVGKKYIFTSDGSADMVEETKADQQNEQAQGPSPEELRREKFFNRLAATANGAVSRISGISGTVIKQATLSSILFYGNDFTFEVFAKNRDQLAKLNIQLKNNFKQSRIEIISSQNRPGSNGGVLGVYKMQIAAPGGAADVRTGKPFASAGEAQNWLSYLVDNGSLKEEALKTRPLNTEDGFQKFELDASVSGSRDNCLQFIQAIGSGGKNIKISKLSMSATNQRTFSKNKYKLRVILQIYI